MLEFNVEAHCCLKKTGSSYLAFFRWCSSCSTPVGTKPGKGWSKCGHKVEEDGIHLNVIALYPLHDIAGTLVSALIQGMQNSTCGRPGTLCNKLLWEEWKWDPGLFCDFRDQSLWSTDLITIPICIGVLRDNCAWTSFCNSLKGDDTNVSEWLLLFVLTVYAAIVIISLTWLTTLVAWLNSAFWALTSRWFLPEVLSL